MNAGVAIGLAQGSSVDASWNDLRVVPAIGNDVILFVV
jgi:hypothetical protein